MEKRIKIVWLLSLISALMVIGVQAYWLFSQYQYVIDNYISETANKILQAGDLEYEIRKKETEGTFSYSINRELNYSNINEKEYKGGKTIMALSSGNTQKTEEQELDSILNSTNFQSKSELINGFDTTEFHFTFDPRMPEDSIIIGTNRALTNNFSPFKAEKLDSILKENIPDIIYTIELWTLNDSIPAHSSWTNSGNLFHPGLTVNYAYSPFEKKGVKIHAHFLPFPIFKKMAIQLFLTFGLILLLFGCLIFQIKTIIKQRKIAELRQTFVNTMIHELKRPVQTLKTFVSFLADKDMRADIKMTEQITQDSTFELDNLSAYLNKLKDMVRADDEQTPLKPIKFNLQELTEKVIRLTHIPAGKDIQFTTSFKMESTFVQADPIHIANILSNLIENAVKYSGQKVEIKITAERKGKELWLSISDNGIGIPLTDQEKVFVKFYRGSNLPDKNLPGLGLGLSYVKLISEAHNGYISLKSNIGEGTTITLFLPQ